LLIDQDPIRAEDGTLQCPNCHISLVESKTPFHFKNQYMGNFDALVCRICRYSLLTSKGYDKALEVARSFGLVGPAEVVNEIIEDKQVPAIIQYALAISLLASNLQKDSKKNNRVELESRNEQLVIPTPYEIHISSKKQTLLLKTQ
jgi:hypothetical protein